MSKVILYVHYVANMCGSGISLKILLQNLDRQKYSPYLLQTSMQKGKYGDLVENMDIQVEHIPTYLVWGFPWFSDANLRGRAWKAFSIDKNVQHYLEKLKPDLIHINDFPPLSVGITANIMGIPIVWHIRHVFYMKHPSLSPWPTQRELIKKIASRIVAISEPEARQFGSEPKLRIVYNPLEVTALGHKHGMGAQIRKQLGIGDDEYVILAPIALDIEKGAWDFIRACGIMKRLAPTVKVRFLLVGAIPTDGRRHLLYKWTGKFGPIPSLEYAKKLAKEGNIQNDLILMGFRSDIYEIMDLADLIVFPSHLKSCGRPCFEAGALEKPIIVTLPEKESKVVIDGVTGLVLPEKDPETLGQAMALLAQNPELGKSFGRAGKEYVARNFDEKTHTRVITNLYDELFC